MGPFTVYGILAVVALYLLLALRATEIFFLSVRDGRTLVVRGRIPPGLLHELSEVVRRARVPAAAIHCKRQGGAGRLVVRGADDGVAQRLRNVFGTRQGAELKLAEPPRDRNLGQRLGIAWLAWRLDGRK